MTSYSSDPPMPRRPVAFRALRPHDRAQLQTILAKTGAFTAAEVEVALELIDEGETDQPDSYRFVLAEVEDQLAGYACFGLASMTDGVFDLYWIAVDPACQGRGVGQRLLREVECRVRQLGGRMVLIETAGKDAYAATRSFYDRAGYIEFARIRDYYRRGDDKVIFGRRIEDETDRSEEVNR